MGRKSLEPARRKERRSLRISSSVAKRDGRILADEREVFTTLEESEARALVAEMANAYKRTVEFYKHQELQPAEAIRQTEKTSAEWRERLKSAPPEEVSWRTLGEVGEVDMGAAFDLWARVKLAAHDELVTGGRAALVCGAGSPYERARTLAVRDSFTEGWRPQNGIEQGLIDMMAEEYTLRQYWAEVAHARAVRTYDDQREALKRFESAGWKSPYQSEADAIEQAHRLADSHNRAFLRTLRQLRDLRRYAPPVIVNNGGQVNVANQQVNVSKAE